MLLSASEPGVPHLYAHLAVLCCRQQQDNMKCSLQWVDIAAQTSTLLIDYRGNKALASPERLLLL